MKTIAKYCIDINGMGFQFATLHEAKQAIKKEHHERIYTAIYELKEVIRVKV